jgi:hypothetical protein
MISNQVCLAKIENRKARRAPIYQHLSDEYHFCLGGGGSSFWRVSTVGDLVACSGRLLVVGGLLRVAVSGSSCGMPAAAFFRASTTRRTMTAQGSVKVMCILNPNNIRAKVSSIFTISLALVSMNPKLCCLLHSSPSLAAICLIPCKSHLLPATMHTGKIWFCSILSSLSMSIICVK